MITSILAFFKAFAEILGIGKFIYQQTKKTESQKEQEIEVTNSQEQNHSQTDGRPKWD